MDLKSEVELAFNFRFTEFAGLMDPASPSQTSGPPGGLARCSGARILLSIVSGVARS